MIGKTDANVAAQSNGKNKKKKKKAGGNNKLLAGAPTVAAAAAAAGAHTITAAAAAGGGRGPRGDKRPQQSSGSDEGGLWCSVHNSRCHNMEECREIKKLAEQFREQ
jgi:hypothetical protein